MCRFLKKGVVVIIICFQSAVVYRTYIIICLYTLVKVVVMDPRI